VQLHATDAISEFFSGIGVGLVVADPSGRPA
jgi:hypothetical protein